MQAYSELLPPTAVTHALKLPFLSAQAENLIVVKTSLLQIFRTVYVPAPGSTPGSASAKPISSQVQKATNGIPPSSVRRARLVLLAEYPLSGTVTSLARIKALNTKSGGEALLVSFKDAKVSLVQWDPAVFSLSTISIHHYENKDLQVSNWAPELANCSTFLTADPSSRAAALKFGPRTLAIIPFRQYGDELAAADFDSDLDGSDTAQAPPIRQNDGFLGRTTPYSASFTLSLDSLDPNVIHPIDLGFLHEYREPTLGVLVASERTSASMFDDLQDVLTYTTFTLDLEEHARTLLLTVPDLPGDLFKLQPLPKPVGGALLVGGNELVHIDRAGKTHAIAVNEFAKHSSSFTLTDQSNLQLKLENCIIEPINPKTGDMMLILSTGDIFILSFRIDGHSVSGMSLRRATQSHNEKFIRAPPSCAVALQKDLIFVGSEATDSLLVRFGNQRAQLSRKRSYAAMGGIEDVEPDEDVDDRDDENDDDYDLYAEDAQMTNGNSTLARDHSMDDLAFVIEDRLPNLTSIGEPCFAPATTSSSQANGGTSPEQIKRIKIVVPTGRYDEGRLSFISKQIDLSTIQNLSLFGVRRTWCLRPGNRNQTTINGMEGSSNQRKDTFDQYMITAGTADGDPFSRLYSLSSGNVNEIRDSYFDNDAITLNAGLLCNGKRIVQVSQHEIRCLDTDLALSQMVPMFDENTDAELSIVQTSFCDPHILVLRDDSSIFIYKSDDHDDQLEELERGHALTSRKWATGCLYKPKTPDATTLAFMVTVEGALNIFQLPNLEEPVFAVEAVNLMPPILSSDNSFRRAPNREKIVELLVADIGFESLVTPTLILRTADDNLALYRPFQPSSEQQHGLIDANSKWLKVVDTSLVKTYRYGNESDAQKLEPQILRIIPNLDGYRSVFVGNEKPRLILTEATGMPKIIDLATQPVDLSPINIPECENGVVLTNHEGQAILSRLPHSTRFGDTGMAVNRVELGSQIETVAYHASSDLFVIGTNQPTAFKLPNDDDWHPEWATEKLSLEPLGNLAKLRLFDPKTLSTFSEITLDENEVVNNVKTLLLEISEITHERKVLVVVGTAVGKGEDLPSNGNVYVYDVVTVVPEPERPETSRKLKQISKEELKGAVTALSGIGNEGLLLTAQGQKCMVRGLKEDNSMLPVAFMDVQCTITALKNVKGTGFALIGDAFKGLWFIGYSIEPYRMQIFGKSNSTMKVVASEFLPQGSQLFVLVADAKCNLNIMEYNPDDPKSLAGHRLLNRNVFHTGHFPTSMVTLPTSFDTQEANESDDDDDVLTNGIEEETEVYNVLLTTQSGAMAIISPVDEQTYRRLAGLQTHLIGLMEHPCGLNPRVYRNVESEVFGGRGLLDGQILRKWYSLSSQRKAEASSRVGMDVWQVHSELRKIAGAGLDYL